MNKYRCMLFLFLSLSVIPVSALESLEGSYFEAKLATSAIKIDGKVDDQWEGNTWYPLNQNILDKTHSAEDFSGRFKVMWDKGQLYLLAEITDDVLFDQHADPLFLYWDDDCLEIFIDEDRSGGDHQFNYNAFAYHVALDNQAVDIGIKKTPNTVPFLTLNDHITSVWRRSESAANKIVWEVAIKVFDDNFKPNTNSKSVELSAGKIMGFMLAYCDNDGSQFRENFIGSTQITPVDGSKNLGSKDAGVFAQLKLIK